MKEVATMAEATNVGAVAISIELDDAGKIKSLVSNALGSAQKEADKAGSKIAQTASKSGKKVEKTATTTAGKLVKEFNKAGSGMESAITKSTGKMASTLKNFAKTAISLYSLKKIFDFGSASVKLASDLQEVQNVVDVTFGELNGQVDAFAKNAITSYGLSETVAKKYMGTFGAMAKSFGYANEEAFGMSKSLTSLAGDVASFYNMTSDEAYTKLKSVFTGETESLKELGVVMTQAALDNYALANGFGKTTQAMTEQEKVMLRYSFVTSKLALAQGDFVRTSGGWANQIRVLKLQFDSLRAAIGEGLIAMLTPVIQMLNILISKLIVAAQAFSAFVKSIFGIKESSGTGSLASDIAQAGAAAEDLSVSTGETASNIKEAAKSLMGFDKLNKLSEPPSSAGAGSIGGLGGLGNIPEIGGATDGSTKQEFELPSAAELGKKLSDLVVGALQMLLDKLKSIDWNAVGNTIGEFLAAVDWGKIFKLVLEVMWEALKGATKVWKGMFDAAPFETAIITAFALLKFTGLGSLVMSSITKAIVAKFGGDSGATIGQAFAGWIGKGFSGVKGLGLGDTALVAGAGTLAEKLAFAIKMIGGIAAVLGGAYTAVKNFVDMFVNGFSWIKEILMIVGIAIAAVGAVILGAPAVVAAVVAAIIAAVATLVIVIKDNWTELVDWWSNVWGYVFDFFDSAREFIVNFFTNLFNAGRDFLTNAINGITNWLTNTKNNVMNTFTNIGNTIKGIWSNITGWFSSKLNAFKNMFVNIFNTIRNTVRNIFNSLVNIVKAPINGVIKIINGFIRGLNKIRIPDWVPGIGGAGINIAQIPMLAQGGYVKANNPRLAIVGDNKHEGEIVAPESKITEAVNNALVPFMGQLVGALRNNQQPAMAGGDIVIPVYIGNNLLDEYIINAQTKNTFRRGR